MIERPSLCPTFLLLLAAALAGAQEDVPGKPVGRLDDRIAESSGLDGAGDVFWTHSDSGNAAEIFQIDRRGALVRVVDLAPLGARNVDWEDVAADGDVLYVGDIGDNRRRRAVLTIYRIEDPGGRSPRLTTIRYAYPDARHDAEGLFVRGGRLWIVSKAREGYTNLYRLPEPTGSDDDVLEAELIGRLAVTGLVTAADFDEATGVLAVMTYRQILLFESGEGDPPFAGDPVLAFPILAGQNEALCWDGPDLLLTNEQRDVFRIENPRSGLVAGFGLDLPRAAIPRHPAAGRELALAGSPEGVRLAARWSEAGLHLEGRFPIDAPATPFDPEASRLGPSLHLLFSTDLDRPLFFGDAIHLVVAFDAAGAARLGRLSHDPEAARPLVDVTDGAEVAGRRTDDGATFEIVVPFPLIGLEGPIAAGQGLLFNCFALETGRPFHWSTGLAESTHEKPYSWGSWTLED